jgi:iron complex outermembrane recepter protein
VAFGQAPTCSTQVTSYTISNPNLSSEQSTQWSAGAAWDATSWLNMSLDYWNIKIDDQIDNIGAGQILACIAGTSTVCPSGLSNLPANVSPPNVALGLGVARAPGTGEILYMQLGFVNLGTIEQHGWDFNARTEFDFGDWGTLNNQLQVGLSQYFSVNGGDNAIGQPGVPKYRVALQNTWDVGDFTVGWNLNYIHSTQSYGLPTDLPSWTTNDIQATWNAPWNGKFTVGVNNVANKLPPLDAANPSGRGYEYELYDGYGRVPYFRYTQSF